MPRWGPESSVFRDFGLNLEPATQYRRGFRSTSQHVSCCDHLEICTLPTDWIELKWLVVLLARLAASAVFPVPSFLAESDYNLRLGLSLDDGPMGRWRFELARTIGPTPLDVAGGTDRPNHRALAVHRSRGASQTEGS